MEGDRVNKYQVPEMEIIRFGSENVITASDYLFESGKQENGESTGGGAGDGWGGF